MDRLTFRLGESNPSYGLEDKASSKPGLFTDYDGFFAHLKAVQRLGQYEDTGLTPEEIVDGQMFSEWISVEERLPPQAKRVLVKAEYDNARLIAIACLQVNKWIVEGAFPEAEATHWLPLPEPPKE